MTRVLFEVEHCTNQPVDKLDDDLDTGAVRRERWRCGCGVEFFLTVTMRACPPVAADVVPLPLGGMS